MIEALVTVIGTGLLGVLGWAFHQSNRITALESNMEGLKELIEVRFAEVLRRLERIERNSNGHKH